LAEAGEPAQMGLRLLQQQRWAEPEILICQSLAIRERMQPGAWTTFNAQSLLGGVLLGQKKYAEAEPLLLARA
jgi:eukaryotic-like serine/threonine-protein kinase